MVVFRPLGDFAMCFVCMALTATFVLGNPSEETASKRGLNIKCGAIDEPCCYGMCDKGLICNEKEDCCTTCGNEGEICCEGMKCIDPSITGIPLVCGMYHNCTPCGLEENDLCCEGNTCSRNSSLTCDLGLCKVCGGLDEPCCDGMKCHNRAIDENETEALVCNSLNHCVPCGYLNEPCCLNGGLKCRVFGNIQLDCFHDGTCMIPITESPSEMPSPAPFPDTMVGTLPPTPEPTPAPSPGPTPSPFAGTATLAPLPQGSLPPDTPRPTKRPTPRPTPKPYRVPYFYSRRRPTPKPFRRPYRPPGYGYGYGE